MNDKDMIAQIINIEQQAEVLKSIEGRRKIKGNKK